jgi:hypothetical protein
MVYDRTCLSGRARVGLSTAWAAGSVLYRGAGRLDATYGATSWDDALRWLATVDGARPIETIQYWGHGRWGRVMIDRDALSASALSPAHRLAPRLAAVRERLVPGGRALLWLRTCEAFGASAGLDFAARLADHLGARVAGHTFVIGALQSGLRALRPGHRPDWSAEEGILRGTPDAPEVAFASGVRRPRTVTCLTNEVPEAWFS